MGRHDYAGVGAASWLLLLAALVSACGGDDDSGASPGNGGQAGSGGISGAGTGGMAGSPATPPLIVARGPEAMSAAWYGDPIYAAFSEPLDPATVDATTVTLTANGEPLAATIELSADGTRVTVTPGATPAPADDGSLESVMSVEFGEGIADLMGDAFAGETWSWDLPLWQRPAGELAGAGAELPNIATTETGELWVSMLDGGLLIVKQYDLESASFQQRGSALNADAGGEVRAQELRVIGGAPHLAWLEADAEARVRVARWDGAAWLELGTGSPASTTADVVRLRAAPTGTALVAWQDPSGSLVFKRWDGNVWVDAAPALTPGTDEGIGEFDFDAYAQALVVAHENADNDLVLSSGTSAGWTTRGTILDRAAGTAESSVSLALEADAVLLGYIDSDGTSRTLHVKRMGADGNWSNVGMALNLAELGSVPALPSASQIRLSTGQGRTLASFVEQTPDGAALHVAELAGAEFRYLGPALSSTTPAITSFAVALDARGNPELVWRDGTGIGIARYNDSPEPPFGLTARAQSSTCNIPLDDDPAFPQTVSATGCYSDVDAQVPAAGLVPYDINSPLWSDGAAKRRFFVLPPGATITYTAEGSWGMPVGTIVVKEFWIEAEAGDPNSLIPMETRFLVKRCDESQPTCAVAWQGYSYQWNDASDEATLLPDATLETKKSWPVTVAGAAAMHSHIYPARGQCSSCHSRVAGRTLGLQTGQLNRPRNYGTTVDNQLRAMAHIGLFGDTFPAEEPQALFRLPSPIDVGHDPETRVRAYFDSNCSQCHRPGGIRATVDFRFSSAATADNICNFLVPGDPSTSPIYLKDSMRGDGQMPPIASDIPDSRQLSLTAAWISGMSSCP